MCGLEQPDLLEAASEVERHLLSLLDLSVCGEVDQRERHGPRPTPDQDSVPGRGIGEGESGGESGPSGDDEGGASVGSSGGQADTDAGPSADGSGGGCTIGGQPGWLLFALFGMLRRRRC